MKKILFAVLALATMASCSNEYVVEKDREAIGFGEAFVDNATKAGYYDGKLVGEFKVYGTVKGTYDENATAVQIYNAEPVTKPAGVQTYTGTAWICANTQYWVPNAVYEFATIVDGVAEATTGLPETIKFTVDENEDGVANEDLLYAYREVTVDNNGNKTNTGNANGLVGFTFDHILSRVCFDITDANTSDNYTFNVTNIKVDGVQKKGIYTVGAQTPWAKDGNTTTTLNFANGADDGDGYQILPVEQTLVVTIYYDTKLNGTKVSEATKTVTIPAKLYAANTCYKVSGQLSLAGEIQFTISQVIGFGNGNIALQ